jgi:hypothetical protein
MRDYLTALDAALPEPGPPRVIAAVGPTMLALCRDLADGAHRYFVPVEHTAQMRKSLAH